MTTEVLIGKELKSVRVGMSMTQPKFAKWLSEKTGEAIEPIKVCRMENFGQRDACHPITPSSRVYYATRPDRLKKSTLREKEER